MNIAGEIVTDRGAASLACSEYSKDMEKVFKCDEYNENKNINIGSHYVDIYKPIFLEGETIGTVQIKASLDEFSGQTIYIIKLSLFIFIALMVVVAFVPGRVLDMIIKPVTRHKEIAKKSNRQ